MEALFSTSDFSIPMAFIMPIYVQKGTYMCEYLLSSAKLVGLIVSHFMSQCS
jgi:hypothetical protein